MNERDTVNARLYAYTDRQCNHLYAHVLESGELHLDGSFKTKELREILNIFQDRGKYTSKPTLHKIVRKYERHLISASEMIGRIMLLENVEDEDL